MKNIAVILSGGSGSRLNKETPKQFIEVLNKELLYYSCFTFSSCKNIDEVYLVCNKNYSKNTSYFLKKWQFCKDFHLVDGGDSREESVYNAIKEISKKYDDAIVLIHDSARPLVSEKIILDNIETCNKYGSAVTAIPCHDSVYNVNNDLVENELNRDHIFLAQTPQTFYLKDLLKSHDIKDLNLYSDDVGLMLNINKKVHIVKGDKTNFKITTIEDLNYLEFLLKNKNI